MKSAVAQIYRCNTTPKNSLSEATGSQGDAADAVLHPDWSLELCSLMVMNIYEESVSLELVVTRSASEKLTYP